MILKEKNKLIKIVVLLAVFTGGFFLGNVDPLWAQGKDAAKNVDMGVFWKAWDIMDNQFVTTKHKNKLGEAESTTTPSEFSGMSEEQRRIYGAIKGMVDSEEDPYTTFFTPNEAQSFETEIKGSFEGVGMEVGIKDGVLTVIAPISGSPAEVAGVKTGDKIIKIDSKTTMDMSVDAAVKSIRGAKGTSVALELYRTGIDKPIDLKVVRGVIQLPTLDKSYDKKTGIYTVKIYSFSEDVATLFKTAMNDFASTGSDKLIIDLRGNPGGYLESAVDISSYFIPQGKVVVSQDYGIKKGIDNLTSVGYTLFGNKKIKVAVLIDGGSASASEIVAGALQDYKVATLIGDQSFGKGSVQQYIKLTDTTGLKVTIARWLTPNGNSISVSGLTPDISASEATSTTIEDIKNKNDNQYLKAVEFLSK
jgi:carboxyl-terminal processing protease